MARNELEVLARRIIACEQCPRLIEHCRKVAAVKRRAWCEWDYWGKPVPPFGDPQAELLIVGLAPGAHGANRTGRMFTGDRAGDFLFRALYDAGFASRPESRARDDGTAPINAWLTAAVRCAPPDNKPSPEEFRNCRPYLAREIELLPRVKVVVALGRLAFDSYLMVLQERGLIGARAPFVFAHNRKHIIGRGLPFLISSYHPSQQNTSTGRLTLEMLTDVFRRARERLQKKGSA